MALISINEAKRYLRVDSSDDDSLISSLLDSASLLCRDVGRLSDEKWDAISTEPTEDAPKELICLRSSLRVAVFYALGYLYEHRDEADHTVLTLTLRSLLFAVREGTP